jgi:hypothetical protein
MATVLALEHVHVRRLSPPCRPRTVPQRCAPRRRARRDAAGICSWRWWSMLSRPIGPEFLAPLQLLGQASVCVSERSARIVRPTPTAGRTGRRALSASRRREAVRQMWYTTALRRVVDARTPIGELPRAHALLRSSTDARSGASQRIPAHPKCARAHACAASRAEELPGVCTAMRVPAAP